MCIYIYTYIYVYVYIDVLWSDWAYAFSWPHLIGKIYTFIAWFRIICLHRGPKQRRSKYLLDPRVPQIHARSICFGKKKLRRWHSQWFTLRTHGPADVKVSNGIWDLLLEGQTWSKSPCFFFAADNRPSFEGGPPPFGPKACSFQFHWGGSWLGKRGRWR